MDRLWNLIPDPTAAQQAFARLYSEHGQLASLFTAFARVVLALLALLIVARCIRSLFSGRIENEVWCYLDLPGQRLHLPVSHWENVIGRSKNSDLCVNAPTVSRIHAALIRRESGWQITDLNSANGIELDGAQLEREKAVPLPYGKPFFIGGVEAVLRPLSAEEERRTESRTPPGRVIKPSLTLYLLSLFQLVLAAQLSLDAGADFTWAIPIGFGLMAAVTWMYFLLFRVFQRTGFEVDFIAFFLCSVGLAVTASSEPDGIIKQLVAFMGGVLVFMLLCWCLRDLEFACSLRWLMAAATIGLLLFTIVAGRTVYGARNWVYIAGVSIQPSELAKLSFVFAGSATLDRLFAKRNILLYLILTGVCAAALAYMNDFGAVIIFFVAFLVAAYLRSGSVATVALISAAAGFGGLIVLKFKPYIAARFSTWTHAWQFAHDGGFQQTRTMSAAASGGLFGVGAGNGWLKTIPAADTDLVFGMLAEEHGHIVALCVVACILALALFSARMAAASRSSFYAIAACTATAMLVFQMSLNVLGSLDILPLTGVTFPFVSNGGSSLVSSFGLLAFVKAVDTRQNASIAARLQKSILRRGKRYTK